MRLPIPSSTALLARLGDGLETATATLGAVTAFVDELYTIAETRAGGQHYQRPAEDQTLNAEAITARAEGAREQVAVGGGLPMQQRRAHLSVVRETPAAGGGSA